MLVDGVAVPAWMVMGLILAASPLTTSRAVPARWVIVAADESVLAAPGIATRPLALVPGARRELCLDVAADAVGGAGFRTIAVSAVTAAGEPEPPGSVWAAVEGLDRPCGAAGR